MPTPERMTAVLAQVHKATASVAQDEVRDPPCPADGHEQATRTRVRVDFTRGAR